MKNVFLVEDDQDDQIFFIHALRQIESATLYNIASNGRAALDILENSAVLPDLIFMDMNMPVMNGSDCLSEITKNPQLRNIPVVFLSSDKGRMEQVRKLGAKAFLKKPSSFVILQQQIEQMINMDFSTEKNRANRTFHTLQAQHFNPSKYH